MERDTLKSVLEGLLFCHPDPLSVDALADLVTGVKREDISSALDELEEEFRQRDGGFLLCRVAGGRQFRSAPHVAPWITKMKEMKPARLSRAALETLSIVAYNQPVTKSRIEQIRGVESTGTLKSLVERDLLEVVGRKDVPGRPILYGTTARFLEVFGLPDLASLPELPELEPLAEAIDPPIE